VAGPRVNNLGEVEEALGTSLSMCERAILGASRFIMFAAMSRAKSNRRTR
jgi:hypothetical protein